MTRAISFADSIYGPVSLDRDITRLVVSPMLQRLRHIRLSNIDSLNMPGIANLSRYEHALGVGYLATQIGINNRLPREDVLALTAAALLHDWAITSFGHLVEEAFRYVGTNFDHEHRLYEIIAGGAQEEVGGVDRQILYGRQTNLRPWAQKMVGIPRANEFLLQITDYIQGHGKFGRLVCGDIDLDNIDSVFRLAVHMGLPVDRECPLRLARAIVDVAKQDGVPVFQTSAKPDIDQWVTTRRAVYERLMLADLDFVGKLMILYATVSSFEKGEIGKPDWNFTDNQLLDRLLSSTNKEVKDTATRWIVGELWDATPLYWMYGPTPDYPKVLTYSKTLSADLSRPCFAYAIRDKRNRLLNIQFDSGACNKFGEDSSQWLLGVGSPTRRPFKVAETQAVVEFAQYYFNTSLVSPARNPWMKVHGGGDEGCLL